jgi:cytochrome P450
VGDRAEPAVVRRFPSVTTPGLDPDPLLTELREHEPVSRVQYPYGRACWLVTRYDDLKVVHTDGRFSRAATIGDDIPRSTPINVQAQAGSIASMDPPDHVRLRKMVSRSFTVRNAEELRPRTAELAAGLLDDIAAAGPPADLIEQLAMPLPIAVICELLGVSFADRDKFRRWSQAFITTTPLGAEEITAAHGHLLDYLAALVADRRARPADDLLGQLVAVRDGGDTLTEAELVNLAFTVLVGGFETTANQIAKGILCLLLNPGELAKLRARPELLPGAVEEILRFISLGAGGGLPWVATDDVELAGVMIRAGDIVVAAPGSANRDDTAFAQPDRFDIERPDNQHVAFGHGAHYCLGANVARMEIQVAIGALVARFPELRLAAVDDPAPWRVGTAIWGLQRLLVDF